MKKKNTHSKQSARCYKHENFSKRDRSNRRAAVIFVCIVVVVVAIQLVNKLKMLNTGISIKRYLVHSKWQRSPIHWSQINFLTLKFVLSFEVANLLHLLEVFFFYLMCSNDCIACELMYWRVIWASFIIKRLNFSRKTKWDAICICFVLCCFVYVCVRQSFWTCVYKYIYTHINRILLAK